jgi:hypothetical protein
MLWPRCVDLGVAVAVDNKTLDLSVFNRSWIDVNHVTSEPLHAETDGDSHSSGEFGNRCSAVRPTQ